MSMVVGEERSSSVLQEINDLFNGRVRAVSSGYGCIDILKLGFTRPGDWKNYSSAGICNRNRSWLLVIAKMMSKC